MATTYRERDPDGAEAIEPPGGEPPLRELVAVLRRRRRPILWTVALLTAAAILAGLQMQRVYTATALVMIEPRESRVVDFQEVVEGLSEDAYSIDLLTATLQTQISLIASDENLIRVAEELDLGAEAGSPPPAHAAGGALGRVLGWLPDSWLVAAGLADEPAALPAAAGSDELRRARAVKALRRNLDVSQSQWSYVLAIDYTSTDPREAARIANGVAAAYVEGQLDRKLAATKRATSWLAERVEELRERVLESERAVEEYRGAKGLARGLDGATLDAQQLAALTTELIDARAERTAAEARLGRVRELRGEGGGVDALAEALSSPLLTSLREQELDLARQEAQLSREYGARHPRIVQLRAEKQRVADRIRLEVDNAIRNLENDVAVARSRERALQQSLDEAKGSSALTGQAGVQLHQLEREAEANRSLYETFLVRLKETEEQQRIVEPDARVISPAEAPDHPSSPSLKLFAAAGFTASLVLGSVLAFVLEQLDGSLRSGRHVEEVLGVPALGLVPKAAGLGRGERLHRYLAERPRSAFTEGVRALYAQLRLADVDRPPAVILVTSALPGEGKTSLAVSLAAFGAQLDQRTLLIDLDLRRPRVGREFDVGAEGGIMEALADGARLDDVVFKDQDTGVDVLAAGGGFGNPTAVLTSRRLTAVLRDARERYDRVVIDTPPVLGVTDAKLLSPQVDAVVFVVQWERTKREAARSAVKELKDAGANVIGAVLNQVDLKRHAYYGYGDAGQYYGKYRKYYHD